MKKEEKKTKEVAAVTEKPRLNRSVSGAIVVVIFAAALAFNFFLALIGLIASINGIKEIKKTGERGMILAVITLIASLLMLVANWVVIANR
jgi:succinate dehydrogenase/fumarate reductase cytochrome b subunit